MAFTRFLELTSTIQGCAAKLTRFRASGVSTTISSLSIRGLGFSELICFNGSQYPRGCCKLSLPLAALVFSRGILGVKLSGLFPPSKSVDAMEVNVDRKALVMSGNKEISKAGKYFQKPLQLPLRFELLHGAL